MASVAVENNPAKPIAFVAGCHLVCGGQFGGNIPGDCRTIFFRKRHQRIASGELKSRQIRKHYFDYTNVGVPPASAEVSVI
jgi:hypothetical protein